MPSGDYDRSNADYGTGVCPCGAEFSKGFNRQKYCSMDCTSRPTRGRRHGTKVCLRCDKEFRDSSGEKGRVYCPDCRKHEEQEWAAAQGDRAHRPRNLRKTCAHCGKSFVANRGQQLYCRPLCKSRARVEREKSGPVKTPQKVPCETCGKKFQQAKVFQRFCSRECWRANDAVKQRARNKDFWYMYGLDLDVLRAWAKAQGGRCEVCRKRVRFADKTSEAARGVVDHDHGSGKVRGLLCHQCNVALGSAKDDPEILIRLAQYLRNAHSVKRQAAVRDAQLGDVSRIEGGKFPKLG